MKDKELQKLNRQDLLKLLLASEKENRRLSQALKEAQLQLERKEVSMSEAGSLAEASLSLNGVFESAQRAADDYLENIRLLCERKEEESRRLATERVECCRRMLAETEAVCRSAEKAARALYKQTAVSGKSASQEEWDEVYSVFSDYLDEHPGLRSNGIKRGRDR